MYIELLFFVRYSLNQIEFSTNEKFSDLLPGLRSGYKALAATPLNAQLSFITASVLWIPSLEALKKFNDYLLGLGTNSNGEWQAYLKWLRPYGCCKHGGIDPDMHGNGIRPFSVNEMSMLAHFAMIYPNDFTLLPVVPAYPYLLNRYVCNISSFGPNGSQVGPPTGEGIWDPNSWGQLMGGTSSRNGRDIGFSDASHIAGQAIRLNRCQANMLCSNITFEYSPSVETSNALKAVEGKSNLTTNIQTKSSHCYTAPYVRCEHSTSYTPLLNLHVHGKRTELFKSQICECPK
jgi:hypothetical protein